MYRKRWNVVVQCIVGNIRFLLAIFKEAAEWFPSARTCASDLTEALFIARRISAGETEDPKS
jgi:hypothetical protein